MRSVFAPMVVLSSLLTLFVILLGLPTQGYAQTGGRTCQYDLECGVGESCSPKGRCVDRGRFGEAERSADDECGSDRRCRIDRLKRKNRARRHARSIREERKVRDLLEREEERRLDEFPRLKDPLSADLRISRLGALGLHAGYVFFGHLQPEFEFVYSDLYVDVFDDAGLSLSGNHTGWWFRGGASYFLLESWFSPYLSAGFVFATGRYSDFSSDFGIPFDESSRGALQTRFHAGEIGGGIDFQFKFGLHTRLGLAYRPLIYNQAKFGPGDYDAATREGLSDWFRQAAAVDVIWLLGWAI